jgi:hypothetical protein
MIKTAIVDLTDRMEALNYNDRSKQITLTEEENETRR